MAIELGANPWILISIMLFELFFIIIPALIASKVEKTSIKDEIVYMGFQKTEDTKQKNILKIVIGISLGFTFFLISGYIIFFFKNILIENLFGPEFIKSGEKGAIKTSPFNPNIFQLIIIISLHFILVGICEEAFFRGFIIKKCERKMKKGSAILLSSVCFGFYHTPPFLVPITTIITYFGYYFTFGILLAIMFKIFHNSLIPCIIAHGMFNTLILIF
ncbi:MAG: lysostaphin resistance A-like protein [Promethearchaeota archaeon]